MKYLPLLLLLTGCSTFSVDENRAGCHYNDGKGSARYGSFTQYAKAQGDVKGVSGYVGENLQGKVSIMCNESTQQIKVPN